MKLKFIVDENVDARIFKQNNSSEHDFIFISKDYPGITDLEVINLAIQNNGIIITEDKDFGEWVFAHKKKIGVIFLRYSADHLENISRSLFRVIEKYENSLSGYFTVISSDKMRMRSL